jgi:hypothetical protein
MAASIVNDAAKTLARQRDHLVLPEVGAEPPTVREDDRLSRTPVSAEEARPITCLDERLPGAPASERCPMPPAAAAPSARGTRPRPAAKPTSGQLVCA